LTEVHRILRPGGIVLVGEIDTIPVIDHRSETDIIAAGHHTGTPHWCSFWEAYRECQRKNGITLEPSQIYSYFDGAKLFDQVVGHYYDIPIGSWPKGK
jgi:hypothetical protein